MKPLLILAAASNFIAIALIAQAIERRPLPDDAVITMDMHRESIGVQNGARIAPASGYPANVSQGAREAWARKIS